MAGFRKFNTLVVSSLIRKFLLVRMSHDLIYLRKWLSIYHSGIVFWGCIIHQSSASMYKLGIPVSSYIKLELYPTVVTILFTFCTIWHFTYCTSNLLIIFFWTSTIICQRSKIIVRSIHPSQPCS